jgi:hypothetical protein
LCLVVLENAQNYKLILREIGSRGSFWNLGNAGNYWLILREIRPLLFSSMAGASAVQFSALAVQVLLARARRAKAALGAESVADVVVY